MYINNNSYTYSFLKYTFEQIPKKSNIIHIVQILFFILNIEYRAKSSKHRSFFFTSSRALNKYFSNQTPNYIEFTLYMITNDKILNRNTTSLLLLCLDLGPVMYN